jgi:Trypsin-like peptidase domain
LRNLRGFKRLGLASLWFLFEISQPISHTQNFTAVAPSILRLTATNCVGNTGLLDGRTATAFIWRDKSTAITALHVVSGCSTINVWYQTLRVLKTAQISKVYRDGDLALLTIKEAMPVSPLIESDHPPTLSDQLQALGFPLQSPTMSSTALRLRFGGQTLDDIVPTAIKTLLLSAKSPSLTLNITNIEGHLVPGLSGAPVLNSQSRVVSIGDGGLENGTVGISWGIPVQALTRLVSSTEVVNPTSLGAPPRALFAAETESMNRGEVVCSGVTLTKLRTVMFANISGSTDDALGLQQLVNFFGIDPRGFQYDVYQHLASGATMVVPAGASLRSGTAGCTYANPSAPNIIMRLQIAPAVGNAETIQVATSQELTAGGGSAQGWFADNAFTNVSSSTRSDGLLVRRKAFVHLDPTLIAPNSMPQDKYLFETLAARNGFELNASVVNNDSTVENNKKAMTCRVAPSVNGCDEINRITDAWVRSVIAVHLATFPIG